MESTSVQTLVQRGALEQAAAAQSTASASASFTRAVAASAAPTTLASSSAATGASLSVERLDPRSRVAPSDRSDEYATTMATEDALWRKLGEVSEAQKAAEREAAATKAVLDRKTQQVAETRRLLFSSEARHIGSEAPRAQKMRF